MRLRFLLLLCSLAQLASATIYNVTCLNTSGDSALIQTALTASVDGDTVNLSGTCDITTTLTLGSGVVLSGSDPAYTVGVRGSGGGGTTILTDNVTVVGGASTMLTITLLRNVPLTLKNFTISSQATDAGSVTANIKLTTYSHSLRLSNITCSPMSKGRCYILDGDEWGVADHLTFSGNQQDGLMVLHQNWQQDSGSYGDKSWATATTLGTGQAFFIEDSVCTITNPVGHGCFESQQGGRIVIRHNNLAFIGSHGTETGQRFRSIRQIEVYTNNFNNVINGTTYTINTPFNLRGGTGVYYSNVISQTGSGNYSSFFTPQNYRDVDPYLPWGISGAEGACDGNQPFDTAINGVFASGTNTSTTTDVLQDSGSPAWTANQWVGDFTILNTTQGWSSGAISNTASSITTFASTRGGAKTHTWANNDAYAIRKAYPCIDQVGRGVGTSYSGATPSPQSAANEAQEPFYQWLDTFNGATQDDYINIGFNHIQDNRDVYAYRAAFNGTVGTGSGTLTPTTAGAYTNAPNCTPKVAYWDTANSTLYQCSATNTWTVYYTPYQYPHPLDVSGNVATLAGPAVLSGPTLIP